MKHVFLVILLFVSFYQMKAQNFPMFSSDFNKVNLPFDLNKAEMKKASEGFGNDELKDMYIKPYIEEIEKDALKEGLDWSASPVAKFDLNGKDGKFQGYIVSYLLFYPMPDQGAVVRTNYMLLIFDDLGEVAVKKGISLAYLDSESFLSEKTGKENFRTCTIESDLKSGLILTQTTVGYQAGTKKYTVKPDSTNQLYILKEIK